MMNVLGSMAIALSMYSKIPVPQVEWTEERTKYAMCFFPLVGVVQGLVLYGFVGLTQSLDFRALRCVGGVVLPLLVNGGIHMDGFLDVVDAKSSYGDQEKKLEILKDPHTGAFAIIGCVVYVLLYLGIFAELPASSVPAMGCVYVLTRGLSGLSVVCFPKAKSSGLAACFSEKSQKQVVAAAMCVTVAVSTGAIFRLAGMWACILCAVAAAGVYAYYYRISTREFGGITGDLAGYFLQICELALMAALVAAARI